jgi:nucleotide-binding universal stress UspA family protein
MKTKISSDPSAGALSSEEQVLETKGSRFVTYHNFLVPIDFSEHSKKTIENATELAALTGASINILHVLQIPDYPAAFYQGLYVEHELVKTHVEMVTVEANAQLSTLAQQILGKGVDAKPILRLGNPYEEIVDAAKELAADLIVIGSHGRTGLGRFLLGSTAERVVQYAPCPVLVVKNTSDVR